MWHCQTLVVPVVLGALGTVHTGIARWLDIIPGHHNLQHLQKTVLLGSNRIPRSHVIFLDSRDGLSTSEAGFASGTCNRLYKPD